MRKRRSRRKKKVKEADELGEEGEKDKAKKKNALVMFKQVEVTAKNVVQLELFLRPGSRRSGPSTRSLLRARRSRSPERPVQLFFTNLKGRLALFSNLSFALI